MGGFCHIHIQRNSLENTGGEEKQFLHFIPDNFLTQHVLEPGHNVLDLMLSLQNELVDNVKMHEPFDNSKHNQIHFDIKVKSPNNKTTKKYRINFRKRKCKYMIKYFAKIYYNNMLMNKTAIEDVIESNID